MEVQLNRSTVAVPARAGNVAVPVGQFAAALAVLFKLRIGFAIMLSALAGALVTLGHWPHAGDTMLLALAVLLAASGAGALNHYFERDIDALMKRTRKRPFINGTLSASHAWPVGFASMIAAGSLLAAWRFGLASGALVLAGAFTYAVVYTLWLKRRTHWNIVIGGAAGSFAVLAGAAAYGGASSPEALTLALVLFLWTPSHFWSLANAISEDYRRAGVPMLPVTRGLATAVRWNLANTLLLVAASAVLAVLLSDPVIWAGVALGGGYLLLTTTRMVRNPVTATSMAAFRASLIQLGSLLAALFIAHAGA